ncbi:MAG: hypothetical protein HY512_03975 [Candidatus Aenigmarchaeota archaeon]|nr:hypothetical protein [Candidatus Aenigmarchaeota archaeon]
MENEIVLGAIQASTLLTEDQIKKINEKMLDTETLEEIREANLDKHEGLIKEAARGGFKF